MSTKPNCTYCKDDPRGVLGMNFYSICPHCNDVPMSGAQKDRAAYDLAVALAKPSPRAGQPDIATKRSRR